MTRKITDGIIDTPEAPPGYHAAIGARGGRKRTAAQVAHTAAEGQRRRKWTIEQEAEAMAAYRAGEATPTQLARKYGLSVAGVWRAIRRARAEEAAKAAEEAASNG